MWKETAATELPKTTAPVAPQPVTEEELRELLDRLGAARHVFRENRELREVSCRCESETRELRLRNAELEEIVRGNSPRCCWTRQPPWDWRRKNERPDTLSQR